MGPPEVVGPVWQSVDFQDSQYGQRRWRHQSYTSQQIPLTPSSTEQNSEKRSEGKHGTLLTVGSESKSPHLRHVRGLDLECTQYPLHPLQYPLLWSGGTTHGCDPSQPRESHSRTPAHANCVKGQRLKIHFIILQAFRGIESRVLLHETQDNPPIPPSLSQ